MSARRWTDNHGDDGLRPKFAVYRPRDGVALAQATVVPNDKHVGADGEFIFVLRPETDRAAALALADYAERVHSRAPQLADDILTQLERICSENGV